MSSDMGSVPNAKIAPANYITFYSSYSLEQINPGTGWSKKSDTPVLILW